MRRPSCSVLRLPVIAIIGERSSQALPTPVARLVAPGPSVAMQSPGLPVMRPVTSAANPAEPSCAVSTNSTPPFRIASISGSTLPLGMPKPRSMPAAFRVETIRSALFMRRCMSRLLFPDNADVAGVLRRHRLLAADMAGHHVPDRGPFGALVHAGPTRDDIILGGVERRPGAEQRQ